MEQDKPLTRREAGNLFLICALLSFVYSTTLLYRLASIETQLDNLERRMEAAGMFRQEPK